MSSNSAGPVVVEKHYAPRPIGQIPEFRDGAPREQCNVCCGLFAAGYTLGGLQIMALPFTLVQHFADPINRKKYSGWRFVMVTVDRWAHLCVPGAAIAFTHSVLISSALWSKNKKTLWEVNWETLGVNTLAWLAAVGAGMFLWRRVLPKRSHACRLLMWDYQRARQNTQYPLLPWLNGRMTLDTGFMNMLWWLNMYCILYGMMAYGMDEGRFTYAMDTDNTYMRLCSPRWREWTELELKKDFYQDQKSLTQRRWGTPYLRDSWRA
eukprot:PhM_4_TR198/c0_g1_i1/m.101519